MEEGTLSENHMTSAAAFVEGGVQEACDDACSICLEAFCDSDPSTLTGCKHEFHLQCILEWCQRSSQCPMCWQPISLKDPSSQELLDAVEHERNIRMNPPRNTAIFHHPTLGDFELQHLPVSATESELEERIIQHLASAAVMGRARHFARREGQRNRSSSQGRPHFLVFSTHPSGASATSSASLRDGSNPLPPVLITTPDSPFLTVGEDSTQIITRSPDQTDHLMVTAPRLTARASQHGTSSNNRFVFSDHIYLLNNKSLLFSRGLVSSSRRSPAHTSPNNNQDRAGPSDFQSFSDTLKSRLTALSSRYKESITKSTRGWKERLFTRNSPAPEPANEGHREASQIIVPSQGIATVTRMMDHLGIADDSTTSTPSPSNTSAALQVAPVHSPSPNEDDSQAPCAASSMSN